MAAEGEVLQLFDFYWFNSEIFTNKSYSSSIPTQKPVHEIHQNTLEPKLPTSTSFHVRSFSDQSLSPRDSFSSDNDLFPSSILVTPKLQTIFYWKEEEFSGKIEEEKKRGEMEMPMNGKVSERKNGGGMRRGRGGSSSLSELEFEELKGFMDLGFVFSEEEERDSRLVSIVPGLQKLGRKKGSVNGDYADKAIDKAKVARPYLSEAWDVREKREGKNLLLMSWRFPDLSDEIDMKNHLRLWAQTVASSIR
ncbi:hypothetical protein Ancab_040323 [Ancistrocladus abbreviatus]